MDDDVYEGSLAPENIRKIRGRGAMTGNGTSAYGSLDRSPTGRRAHLKDPIFDVDRMWNLLHGSYDVHVHGGPASTTARIGDELDLALDACRAGIGGLVFKNHDSPSTRTARLVQHAIDVLAREHDGNRVEVFGGVVLNEALGGLNPEAVVSAYRLGGRYVWLPSLDAQHHRRVAGQSNGQGISLLDEEDKLTPQTVEIFKLVAETDMVLAFCHQSMREKLVGVREAVRLGVKRIEVCHPNFAIAWMTPQQCQSLADMGAFIGIYALDPGVDYTWDEVMAIYQSVGAERIVFGSDGGQLTWPHPTEGMRKLIAEFLTRGVPDEKVRLMCRQNAYNLLH